MLYATEKRHKGLKHAGRERGGPNGWGAFWYYYCYVDAGVERWEIHRCRAKKESPRAFRWAWQATLCATSDHEMEKWEDVPPWNVRTAYGETLDEVIAAVV